MMLITETTNERTEGADSFTPPHVAPNQIVGGIRDREATPEDEKFAP